MNQMLYIIGRLLSIVYPYALELRFRNLLNKIYSIRVAKCISGGDLNCERPVILHNGRFIKIGSSVKIYSHSILAAHSNHKSHGNIMIGNGVTLGEYSHITSLSSIYIGNNVLFGRRVTVTDNSHGSSTYEDMKKPPLQREICSKAGVVIEDNVWIGDNVVVLPGVHIGKGTIIGANAVVVKDIPSYCVAVGNPAKVVKNLGPKN